MKQCNVGIIMVTHNNEDEISRVLSSIKQYVPEKNVFIVDNASTDNTVEIITKQTKQWPLIVNEKNLGFSKAVNQAIEKMTLPYLLLLNPDTVMSTNVPQILWETFAARGNCAAVTCMILNKDHSMQPTCGMFPTITNIMLDRVPWVNTLIKTEIIRNKRFYQKDQDVDWISGVCLFTSKNVMNIVGKFREDFFMYGEDIEWCYRARKMGFSICYTSKTHLVHLNKGKSKKRKKNKFYYMRQGFLIFFRLHRTPREQFMLRKVFLLESLVRSILARILFSRIERKEWIDTYKKVIRLTLR